LIIGDLPRATEKHSCFTHPRTSLSRWTR